MFKSNPDEDISNEEPSGGETIIGVSVKLEGDFKSEGDVTINGEVSGTVKTKGDLEIGETAVLSANLEARSITVSGKVEGSVKALDKLKIKSSGKIMGNVECQSLEIAEGAYFDGECKMGTESQSDSEPATE